MLPRLPRTLPKRTQQNSVLACLPCASTIISHTRFEAPMTEVGFTALSVEICTNRETPNAKDCSPSDGRVCEPQRERPLPDEMSAARHGAAQQNGGLPRWRTPWLAHPFP